MLLRYTAFASVELKLGRARTMATSAGSATGVPASPTVDLGEARAGVEGEVPVTEGTGEAATGVPVSP